MLQIKGKQIRSIDLPPEIDIEKTMKARLDHNRNVIYESKKKNAQISKEASLVIV